MEPTRRLTQREIRHRLVEMARRKAKPGTGSTLEFLARRTWSPLPVDLTPIRTPFTIVGAVATRLYMVERASDDIDLLVTPAERPGLRLEMTGLGWRPVPGPTGLVRERWITPGDYPVDVLTLDEPWMSDLRATDRRSPEGFHVVDLPYLVLLKLMSSHANDIGDLSRMLGWATPEQRKQTRVLIARYAPEDVPDLENLIYLGDLELQ